MTHYRVYISLIGLNSEGDTGPIPLQATGFGAAIMADSAVFPHPDGSGGTVEVTALPLPVDPYVLSFGDTLEDIQDSIRASAIASAAAGFTAPGGVDTVPPITIAKHDVIFL